MSYKIVFEGFCHLQLFTVKCLGGIWTRVKEGHHFELSLRRPTLSPANTSKAPPAIQKEEIRMGWGVQTKPSTAGSVVFLNCIVPLWIKDDRTQNDLFPFRKKKVKLGNWNLPVEWRTSEFCHRLHPKELLLYVSGLVKGRLNIQFVYKKKSEQFFAEHIPRMHVSTRVFLNREKGNGE
jgi:hypothetical protein